MIFKKNYPNDIFRIISSISNILSIQTREKSKLETQSSFDGQIDAILTSAYFFLFFVRIHANWTLSRISYPTSKQDFAREQLRLWTPESGSRMMEQLQVFPCRKRSSPALVYAQLGFFEYLMT